MSNRPACEAATSDVPSMKSAYHFLSWAILAMAQPCLASGPGTANDFGGKRVLIVGIDGLRSDALQAAKAPNIMALAKNGVTTYNAFSGGELGTATEQPTISGPGWLSILTGVYANRHKVSDNDFAPYSRDITKEYPHFFRRIKTTFPKSYLASISSWAPIEDSIVVPAANSFDYHSKGVGQKYPDRDMDVKNKAVAQLTGENPDLLFVHFDQADGAGHATGFKPDNPAYLKGIEAVDAHIGSLMEAIKSRPQYSQEKWLVMIVTDHGGTAQGTHGGQSQEERTIPLIISGGDAEKGLTINDSPGLTTVPPTIFRYLGIPVKEIWNWDSPVFGYAPHLRSTISNQSIKLEWTMPDGGLPGLSGIDIRRNGKPIAALDIATTNYRDLPQRGSSIYEVSFRGTKETRTSHVYIQGEINDQLVLHLPFNGNTQDSSGKSNHGKVNGTPTYTAGRSGQCLQFNEMGKPRQYVDLGQPKDLQFEEGDSFTVSVWVNHTGDFPENGPKGGSSFDPAILSNKDWKNGVNIGWYIGAGENGRWQWNVGDGSKRADYDGPSAQITDGQWHHLCVVHDRTSDEARMYYDGEHVTTKSLKSMGSFTSGKPTAVATDGTFGEIHPAWFTGKIDEVKIWRRALDHAEVKSIYKQ